MGVSAVLLLGLRSVGRKHDCSPTGTMLGQPAGPPKITESAELRGETLATLRALSFLLGSLNGAE